MTQTHTDLLLTMKPIFLEDYFVRATYYADETEHKSGFWPLSSFDEMPDDYQKQLEVILADATIDYIKIEDNTYQISMSDYFDYIVIHDLFEKMADYFSCLNSFGYLEIRRCFGWRFEHQINGITPNLIVTPWQVDQLNLTQADTVLHMQQVLSGELHFYNTL